MKENKLIPKRRFKEFINDEAWEQRKLSDEVQITMGQSPDGNSYTDYPSDYILVQGNADLKNGWVTPRVWTSQVTKKAEAGDLIMSVRAPAGEVGKTAYNAVIGRGVAAIKGNGFIFQRLVKMHFEGYWKRISCGSTFESLNSDNIKNAEIMIPHLNEQLQIGSFFGYIDNLITLHQRKFKKLKDLKTAYFTEMFPQEGEKCPKRRFTDFTDHWEQSKLGEVAKLGSSKRVHREDYVEAGIPFFRGLEITKLGSSTKLENVLYITDKFYNDLKSKYSVPEVGDILITAVGTLGNCYLVSDNTPFYFKDGNLIWVSDIEIDSEYLNIYLGNGIGKKAVLESAVGSNQKALTMVKLQDIQILFPSIKEQQRIASFYKVMDKLINLHQDKLEKLENIKKAYLNEMFV